VECGRIIDGKNSALRILIWFGSKVQFDYAVKLINRSMAAARTLFVMRALLHHQL